MGKFVAGNRGNGAAVSGSYCQLTFVSAPVQYPPEWTASNNSARSAPFFQPEALKYRPRKSLPAYRPTFSSMIQATRVLSPIAGVPVGDRSFGARGNGFIAYP